jgi:hypothetical protein
VFAFQTGVISALFLERKQVWGIYETVQSIADAVVSLLHAAF